MKSRSFAALTSSNSSEWYTPPPIIEMARDVMGSIELDPASNHHAQQWIRAGRYFTAEHNGLLQPWKASTIYLNPPYSNLGSKFCSKLLQEWLEGNFKQAVVLVRGDSAAMQRLFDYAYHCRSRRIKFIPSPELLAELIEKRGEGWKNSPVPGSTIFYFGDRTERFASVFASQGKIFAPAIPQSAVASTQIPLAI